MEDTTLKQVSELKEKNRRDIWGDSDGYIWFWDIELKKWTCLSPCAGGCARIYTDAPSRGFGPYARVLKGWR